MLFKKANVYREFSVSVNPWPLKQFKSLDLILSLNCLKCAFKFLVFILIFSWEYFSHDQARSRAYRWGEDGLLGITDRECRLCFALALWNGKDAILKERLFGLTGPQGMDLTYKK